LKLVLPNVVGTVPEARTEVPVASALGTCI
jgi:hypothetical protein